MDDALEGIVPDIVIEELEEVYSSMVIMLEHEITCVIGMAVATSNVVEIRYSIFIASKIDIESAVVIIDGIHKTLHDIDVNYAVKEKTRSLDDGIPILVVMADVYGVMPLYVVCVVTIVVDVLYG